MSPVSAITLEDIISEFGPIDLIEMDIEGSEHNVIGYAPLATLKQIRKIVMEVHVGSNRNITSLIRRLVEAGMEVYLCSKSRAFNPAKTLRSPLTACDSRNVMLYRMYLALLYTLNSLAPSILKWHFSDTLLLYGRQSK
jgi:hypothetical protein